VPTDCDDAEKSSDIEDQPVPAPAMPREPESNFVNTKSRAVGRPDLVLTSFTVETGPPFYKVAMASDEADYGGSEKSSLMEHEAFQLIDSDEVSSHANVMSASAQVEGRRLYR
jgi:hypothetical protein